MSHSVLQRWADELKLAEFLSMNVLVAHRLRKHCPRSSLHLHGELRQDVLDFRLLFLETPLSAVPNLTDPSNLVPHLPD